MMTTMMIPEKAPRRLTPSHSAHTENKKKKINQIERTKTFRERFY